MKKKTPEAISAEAVDRSPGTPVRSAAGATGLVVTDVRDLLGDAREAILLLDGEPYRLRITARQKLILTK